MIPLCLLLLFFSLSFYSERDALEIVKMPYRCLLGCQARGTVPLHSFPNPNRFPDSFRAWVVLFGGDPDSPDEVAFYLKKKICDIHFEDTDKNRNNRLNCLAVPSLFLSRNHNPVDQTEIARVLGAPAPSTSTQIGSTGYSPADYIQEVAAANTEPKTNPTETSTGCHTQSVRQEVHETRKVPIRLVERTKPKPVVCRREQKQITTLRRKIHQLKSTKAGFKARLASAEKMSADLAFMKVTQSMTSAAKIFTNMQFRQTQKKPSGRRFSLDEKILSMTIFKKSRKCYGLLAKIFALPSPKTLKLLLAKIKVNSGLNQAVFDKIKETVKHMDEEDRLCSLLFDEMSISPEIHFDQNRDRLRGFSDFHKKIADHVLVFMIKGVKANFKQPVAYYYTNSIGKYDLKRTVVEVIQKIQATGLTVLCTICDQGTANVGAINELVQDQKNQYLRMGKAWRHDHFQVDNKQIVPLFDVPHLLKGLRNNLLTKDLLYVDYDDSNTQKIVKWDYLQKVYAADKSRGDLTLLHKLTEEHLVPEKIKKMRVKTAAQIFSHSVAVATEHLTARGLLDEECRQLIPLVSLIDKLFDSLNSSTFHIPNGKIFKGCVRRTSPHHDLWQKALKTLKSMKFLMKKKTGNKVRIVETTAPSIKNFIKTIEGMKVLWKILSRKYSFDCMFTRNFNQDPLENFFGNIRSYGARYISPNAVAFDGAFKALLLNNYNAPHSINGNCEEDTNRCLQNFDFFLKNKHNIRDVSAEEPANTSSLNIELSEDVLIDNCEREDLGQRNYACGWVLKKCLKNVIKGCKTCKEHLLTDVESKNNGFLRSKEYNKNKRWLVYPSPDCERAFGEIQNITVSTLKTNVPHENLKYQIKSIAEALIYFPCNCAEHYERLKCYFVDNTINIIIHSWCRSVNRLLAGAIKYDDGDDETKIKAQQYYLKHKHNKTKK